MPVTMTVLHGVINSPRPLAQAAFAGVPVQGGCARARDETDTDTVCVACVLRVLRVLRVCCMRTPLWI